MFVGQHHFIAMKCHGTESVLAQDSSSISKTLQFPDDQAGRIANKSSEVLTSGQAFFIQTCIIKCVVGIFSGER